MTHKKRICSVVVGQPSAIKANGVLRYCHDMDKILTSSQNFEHKELAIKKRHFVAPLFFILPKISLLKKILDLKDEEFIIFHGIYHPIFIIILILCRHSKIGIMPHGSFHPAVFQKKKFLKVSFILIYKFFSKRIKLITVSQNEASHSQIVMGKGIPILNFGPMIYIKNGTLHRKSNLHHDQLFKILFLGRFDIHTKGLDTLIEVAELMRNRPIEFQLVGPADNDGYIWLQDKIKELRLSKTVKLYNAVFGDDKFKLINQASFFILLSRNEGFPLAAVEALGYGCPCIVTKATNFPNFDRDTSPVIFVERDASEISNKIIDILDNQDISKLKIEAKKVFHELYGESSILNRLETQINLFTKL